MPRRRTLPFLLGGLALAVGIAFASSMTPSGPPGGGGKVPEVPPPPQPPAPIRRRQEPAPPPSSSTPPPPPPRPPVGVSPDVPPEGMAAAKTVVGQKIIEAYPKSAPIIDLLLDTASAIGAHAIWLANLIDFESGHSWSPSKRNPSTGAVGLIQFIGGTAAERLGMKPEGKDKRGRPAFTKAQRTAALDEMGNLSARQQMVYVRAYLRRWARARGPLNTKHKLHLAVFYPSAINRDPNAPLSDDPEELAEIRAKNNGIDTGAKYSAHVEASARLQV